MAVLFIDDDFKADETMMALYAVECFVKVEQEGPSDFIFEVVGVGDDANTVDNPITQEILPDVVDENHNHLRPVVDCDEVRGAGVEVIITYPHQRTSQHQMKKYRVSQVTRDSIGSVITGQQGIEISPPNWRVAMGGVHSHCYSISSNSSLLQFLKMLLLQTSTKSLKGSRWNIGRCAASLDWGS